MVSAIHEIMASQNVNELTDPKIKSSLENVTKLNIKINDNLTWAAIISPSGDYVIVENARDAQNIRAFKASDSPSSFKVNSHGNDISIDVKNENSHDVSIPISEDGKNFGQVYLRLDDSPHYKQMEESSQRITKLLTISCVVMLLFVLAIFLVLWKLFSKQLELQQKNAQLDRMAYVGTLASGLAHEIRNPLTSMSINLDVLQEDLQHLTDPIAQQGIELSANVKKEVLNLNATLTSFLDFALPRREGLSLFNLRALMDELYDLHKEQLKAEQITYEIDSISLNECTIEADRKLFHQAIRNVFLNAVQILSGQVKRVIRVRIENYKTDYLSLTITDSGPGIPAENLTKIFEVFYTTRRGGSGFGLAIAKKIVEDHGGILRAANNLDTRGCHFVFIIPKLAVVDRFETSSQTINANF